MQGGACHCDFQCVFWCAQQLFHPHLIRGDGSDSAFRALPKGIGAPSKMPKYTVTSSPGGEIARSTFGNHIQVFILTTRIFPVTYEQVRRRRSRRRRRRSSSTAKTINLSNGLSAILQAHRVRWSRQTQQRSTIGDIFFEYKSIFKDKQIPTLRRRRESAYTHYICSLS